MLTNGKIQLASGFIFDYETMLGEYRITEEDLQEMSPVEIIDLYEMYKEEDD